MLSIKVKDAIKIYREKNVFLWSAFLTYLTVLNVVPFIYFSIFILSHIPFVNQKIPYFKKAIVRIIPAYSTKILAYFNLFLAKLSSMELLNSIIFSISMLSLIFGFFKAVREILSIKEKFKVFRTIAFVLINILSVGVMVFLIVALKIVVPIFMPKIANIIYVQLIPFIIWFVFLFSLFYVSKSSDINFFSIFSAAFITTLAIFILKLALGWYFSLFSYSKIYGAVAIVPSLLLWLFLLWNVILFGIILSKVIKI